MQLTSSTESVARSAAMLLSATGQSTSGSAGNSAVPTALEAAAKAAEETAVVVDALDAAVRAQRGEDRKVTYDRPKPAAAKVEAAPAGSATLSAASRETAITVTEDGFAATASRSTLEVGPDGIYQSTAELTLARVETDDGVALVQSFSVSRSFVGSLAGFGRYADEFA